MYNNQYTELYHFGIKGQKHGVRRWQNEDGSLTPAGYEHYGYSKRDLRKIRKDYNKLSFTADKNRAMQIQSASNAEKYAKKASKYDISAEDAINAGDNRKASRYQKKVNKYMSKANEQLHKAQEHSSVAKETQHRANQIYNKLANDKKLDFKMSSRDGAVFETKGNSMYSYTIPHMSKIKMISDPSDRKYSDKDRAIKSRKLVKTDFYY